MVKAIECQYDAFLISPVPTPEFEDLYVVHATGEVRHVNGRPAYMRQQKPDVWPAVTLVNRRGRIGLSAARLVWEAFRGKLPRRVIVRPLDGNYANTRLENLSVGTLSDVNKKLTDAQVQTILRRIKREKAWGLFTQIAHEYRVSVSLIEMIANGKRRQKVQMKIDFDRNPELAIGTAGEFIKKKQPVANQTQRKNPKKGEETKEPEPVIPVGGSLVHETGFAIFGKTPQEREAARKECLRLMRKESSDEISSVLLGYEKAWRDRDELHARENVVGIRLPSLKRGGNSRRDRQGAEGRRRRRDGATLSGAVGTAH